MDEYLFIALAKLRADRLTLERGARAESVGDEASDGSGQPQERHSPRARRVNPGSPGSQENLFGEQSCIP